MIHDPALADHATCPDLEIRVINLARATQRRAWMEQQMAPLNRPWSFFEAHTALMNPRLRFDPDSVRRTYGRDLTPGQVALWSSHYTVIAEFAETSASGHLLVMEDDLMLDPAFPLDELIGWCKGEDIHYMRLYGMYHRDAEQLSYFYDRAILRYHSSPSGTQAYLLSKEGARRIAETCRLVDTAWDLALDEFWKTGLPLYSVYPFPALERFSPSSVPINDIAPLDRADRIGFVKTRVVKKLCKIAENRRLRRRDRAMQARDQGFRQVGP